MGLATAEKALTAEQRRCVLEHMKWACKVVARLGHRHRWSLGPEDVRQMAHEGLTRAAQAFNRDLGVPFAGFALKYVRGAVKKAGRVEARFHGPLFVAAEHWTEDGDPYEETDESARDALYARAGEGAAAMLFGLVGQGTHALSTGSEDHAIEGVLATRLREALARVPVRPREVIERRLLRGEEIAEVADAMGVSPITVRRDYQKGIQRLSKSLRGAAPQDDSDE